MSTSSALPPEERLQGLLRRLRSLPMFKPPTDLPLSPPQAALLRWVAKSPGCGVRDIARGLNVTPPTVSVGVHRLVDNGWLEQRSDPNDRRARPIYPTEKGQKFLSAWTQHRDQMLGIFLSGLESDEQETLIDLLERAINALEKAQEKKQ